MIKKILIVLSVLSAIMLAPTSAFAAVTYVNSDQKTVYPILSTSESYSYTASSSSNEGLVFNVLTNSSAPSSVSYDGTSASLVASTTDGAGNYMSTWRLENPSPGANTVALTGLSYGTYLEVNVIEYAGVDQSNMDDGHDTGSTPNGGTLTLSQTTSTAGAWVMSYTRNQLYPVMSASTGVGATRTSGSQSSNGDSDGPISPAGSYSMTWTSSDATYKNWGIIMAIKPAHDISFINSFSHTNMAAGSIRSQGSNTAVADSGGPLTEAGVYSMSWTSLDTTYKNWGIIMAIKPSGTITYVNSGTYSSGPAGVSETYPYTASSSSNEGLVFDIFADGPVPLSVSYAGASSTLVATTTDGAGNYMSTWRLENPSPGTHDIVVNSPGTSTVIEVNVLEYEGVDQTNMDDGHDIGSTANGGTLTLSQTTSINGAWVESFVRNQLYPIMTITPIETIPYTTSSSNDEGLIFNILSNTSAPLSVSYAGASSTLVATTTDGAGNYMSTWRLENPSPGTHDIVVNGLSAGGYFEANIAEYAGIDQANMDDGHDSSSTPNGGTLTLSQTTSTDGAWTISFARNQLYPVMSASTGVGATRASGYQSSVGDSNGPINPAGAYSMTWTSADSIYKNQGIIMALKPS